MATVKTIGSSISDRKREIGETCFISIERKKKLWHSIDIGQNSHLSNSGFVSFMKLKTIAHNTHYENKRQKLKSKEKPKMQ